MKADVLADVIFCPSAAFRRLLCRFVSARPLFSNLVESCSSLINSFALVAGLENKLLLRRTKSLLP